MSTGRFHITAAAQSDLDEILALLTGLELPGQGVAEHLSDFVVARDDGRLVGCAGLELYGAWGLLRSVAVASDLQGFGLGSLLTSAALKEAQRRGVGEVVLLTTTAQDFFARRFGFEEKTRADYEQQFIASAEWQLPRCSSAVVMRLNLIASGTHR